ncbi:MAG: hypothetical protein ACPGSC_10380 [Granulosicoccaceae bacterium]
MIVKNVVVLGLLASMASVQAQECKDSTTIGSWLSGEAVADNPDGEDYAADSGSMLMLGCTVFLDKSYRYTGNLSVGYRYQLDKSGKGRNSGWAAEGGVSANFGGLMLGVGAIYQFKAEVRDYFGARTKIEPSFGGFVSAGIALGPGLELQVRRHYLTLESESGDAYEPAEYGVFLHRSF